MKEPYGGVGATTRPAPSHNGHVRGYPDPTTKKGNLRKAMSDAMTGEPSDHECGRVP